MLLTDSATGEAVMSGDAVIGVAMCAWVTALSVSAGDAATRVSWNAAQRFRATLRQVLRLLRTVARSDVLLLRVFRRRLLDHCAHELLVRLDPVGDHLPLVAVPLLELYRAAAFVIGAGHLRRLHEVVAAELLQSRVADLEVLDPPPHLLSGQRLLAVLFLRLADRLDRHDAVDDAPVVVDRTDARLVFHLTLTLGINVLLDLLDHREVGAGYVKAGRDVALRCVTCGDRVFLGARPPDAHDVISWKADLGRRLQRRRVHYPPTPQDHPVRLDLPNLQPLRALLVPWMRHRDVRDGEAVLLRLRVENRDGLLAVTRVVIDVDELLALELVHPAFPAADELDLGGVLRPVVRDQRKDIRENPPVARVGASVSQRNQRNMVGGHFVDQRVCDARRQRVDHRRAGGTLVLLQLVALDAAGAVVLRLALFVGQLDAAHATVARAQHVDVVDAAAEDA